MGKFHQIPQQFDGAIHRWRWYWRGGVCALLGGIVTSHLIAQAQPQLDGNLGSSSPGLALKPRTTLVIPPQMTSDYAERVDPLVSNSSVLMGLAGKFNQAVRDADVSQLRECLESRVAIENWEGTGDDGIVAHCVRQGQSEMGMLLLSFGADPHRSGYEGGSPLQMAIALRDSAMVKSLLLAGADPNQSFPRPISEEFLAITEKDSMQWFLKRERRITPLMMAANNGDLEIIKSLLDHGAEKYIQSGRYRLYPLNFASRRSDVKAMQVMLGKDPEKEPFHIVLDLSDQRLKLYDSQQKVVFSSRVSTGRSGYRTPKGEFVISDKHRSHRSTIYHVKMPYFQRLSCSAIGFHAGYVPGYPASHGCIRMPYESAKELFATTPAGTRVVIQE